MEEAPLAVVGSPPASGLFAYDKFSSAPFLIDAVRNDARGEHWARRRLPAAVRGSARTRAPPPSSSTEPSRVWTWLWRGAPATDPAAGSGRIRGHPRQRHHRGDPAGPGLSGSRRPDREPQLAATGQPDGSPAEQHHRPDPSGSPRTAARTAPGCRDDRFPRPRPGIRWPPIPPADLRRGCRGHRPGAQHVAAGPGHRHARADPREPGSGLDHHRAPVHGRDGGRPEHPSDPTRSWIDLSAEIDEHQQRRAYVNLTTTAADETLWQEMDQAALTSPPTWPGLRHRSGSGRTSSTCRAAAARSPTPGHSRRPPGAAGPDGSEPHTTKPARCPWARRCSVTDARGRFHGLSNAYVVGPAIFPTLGSANPALTALALARRTAELLVQDRTATPPPGFVPLSRDPADWTLVGRPGSLPTLRRQGALPGDRGRIRPLLLRQGGVRRRLLLDRMA